MGLLFLLACSPDDSCADKPAAEAAIDPGVTPDLEFEAFDVTDLPGVGAAEEVHFEVWDCIELSWWSDTEPVKVVQVWVVLDTCPGYDEVWYETYACGATDSIEEPYIDADGDGSPRSEDCDDTDASVTRGYPWYADADGDGYGAETGAVLACTAPDGYLADDQDCDDTDASANPDGVEVCDGADQDCDGVPDDGVTTTWYADTDGDGFGDPYSIAERCHASPGWRRDASDCDDSDAAVNPDAPEVCDGRDNDCDGDTDERGEFVFYLDRDGDGHGDPAVTRRACEESGLWVSVGDDCDDAVKRIHPGADEFDCTDPTDYNCDGSNSYADEDGDGFPACRDCDDTDATRDTSTDLDGDGWATCADCDDADATVGADDDGSGLRDCADIDGDGWTEAQGDADDLDPAVNPGVGGDTGGDSGNTADTGGADTGGADTDASSDTSADTAASGDTGASSDTAPDTGASSDTGTSPTDTGVSPPDTAADTAP